MNSLILRTTTRFMLPLLLMFSVYLLLRGHNEPGGGFSGGLVAASAFTLYGFAYGVHEATRALTIDARVLTGVGLLAALAGASLSLARGLPVMTGLWGDVKLPGFAEFYVGTPLLFDIGVYLVVVGVTLSIILPLAEQ